MKSGVKNFWIPLQACSNSFSISILNCFVLVSDNCRLLAFPPPFFFINKRFVNHTIGTKIVVDIETCKLQCYYEHNCVSVNYHVNTKTCELNNATHRWHDNEFKNEDNYLYHGADVRFFLILIIANPPPHISLVLPFEFVLRFSSSRSRFCSCLCSFLFVSAFVFFFVFVFVSVLVLVFVFLFMSLSVFVFEFVFVFVFACSSLSSSCCSSFATTVNLFLTFFSYLFLVTNFI